MKSFFEEDKQSEILVQWKAKFEAKLDSLAKEKREHAKYKIQKLGAGRAVFSTIDEEKKRIITTSVKYFIKDMKQEDWEEYKKQ